MSFPGKSQLSFSIYAIIATAAFFACSTAWTTVLEPCTTSPAAKTPFSGGHFVFVYDEETFVGAFQSYCCADQAVSWSLADGDDRGICFHLVFAFLVSDDFIILINDRSLEYRAGFP